MRISKELFRDDVSDDDCSPVVIRIFHRGMVRRVATGVWCRGCDWNPCSESVACGDADHSYKNCVIDDYMRRVAGRIQDWIDDYLSGCLSRMADRDFIVEREAQAAFVTLDSGMRFMDLIERKMESVRILNTRRGYETFRRYFRSRYGEGPSLRDIDKEFLNDVAAVLESDYPPGSSMRHHIGSRFNSVLSFAMDNGLMPMSSALRLPKYRVRHSGRNLSEEELRAIFRIFYVRAVDGFDITDFPMMSLAVFILDMAFQGLAPVDLASLRIGDLRFQTLYAPFKGDDKLKIFGEENNGMRKRESMRVVEVETFRRKTGGHVSVVAFHEPIRVILDALCAGRDQDDFLIPCFRKGESYTPERRQNRLANYFNRMTGALNAVVGEAISAYCGSTKRVTYYYARHAYCNTIDSLDVPRFVIQTLVGHKSTVLEKSYLRPISPWEQACVSRDMFRLLMPPDAS